MNLKLFTPFILAFITVSCTKNNSLKQIDGEEIIINVGEIEENKLGKYSDVYDTVKIVKLETTDESLIGRIDKMIYYNDKIFILDQLQRKVVFEFDSAGKYVRTFGANGKGPGEYDEPNDMAINRFTQEMIVWSSNSKKLLFFDLEGHFKREIKINFFAKCFAVIEKNLFAFYLDAGYKYAPSEFKSNLILIDGTGKIISSGFEIEEDRQLSKGGFYFFNQFKENTFISPGYSNSIYSLDRNKIEKKYYINFGAQNIPDEYFKQEKLELDKKLRTSKYTYLNSYFDTPKYLVFSFVYKNLIYTGFYSKKTKKVSYGNIYINDVNGILTGTNMTSDGDFIVGCYDPFNISSLKSIIKYPVDSQLIKSKTIEAFESQELANFKEIESFINSTDFSFSKREIKNIESIKPSDNPVIVIRKLK